MLLVVFAFKCFVPPVKFDNMPCSHHAPYELVQSKFKELVIDSRAPLVFDWCKRVLDDYYCEEN